MTKEEKCKAIISRVPVLDDTFTEQHISFILILAYLRDLAALGVIAGGKHHLSDMGVNIGAVCEEFDWKPSNEDVDLFVTTQVQPESAEMIRFFITEYRDNRDKMLESLQRFKNHRNC